MYNLSWKKAEVSVYNKSDWKLATMQAIQKWNEANIGVKFVLSNTPTHADLIIETDEKKVTQSETCMLCMGRATLGRNVGKQAYIWLLPDIEHNDKQMRPEDTAVVAHEMGHILGLEHRQDTCSLMNPQLKDQRTCPLNEEEKLSCGPLPIDLFEIEKKYNKPWSKHYSPLCPKPKSKIWYKTRQQNILRLPLAQRVLYSKDTNSFQRQEKYLLEKSQ